MTAMTKTPLRVLIVDDNPEDCELYRRFLKQEKAHEYHIIRASFAEEGLALCRSGRPDCVLVDYRLPDLDGLEFLTALAGDNGTTPVPAIMLTGYGDETLVAEAMKAGAADYLPKSALSSKSLGRAIANAVEKFKLRVAVEEQRYILEQTNEELRHKHEEIRSFYHVLSHELKTPLTVIMGYLAIVLDGHAGSLNQEQQECLSIAKDSCDQITLALNDLLDATRLETGKLTIAPHPMAIDEVVAQVVASMLPAAHGKGIHVQHVIAPDLPDVLIDDKRMIQVLSNLLSNALKFTPEGGDVEVAVTRDPQRLGGVLVAVKDTGRGIEPEQCRYIFDRLYQVRGEDAESNGGLGLGLYICRELVRLHGGEIWVESTPGQGSTFFFTVPEYAADDMCVGVAGE
jgi:two-component system, sensor histidine kinase and response regulator